MTGKLIKYEVKSSIRLMGIIWAALMAASVLAGISSTVVQHVIPEEVMNLAINMFAMIPPILYGAIFVAMVVVTVLLVVMRFYRGLLGDEGYLMHTLPVRVWQLITAKGAVAAGIVSISCLLAVLSIMILVGFTGGFGEMMEVVGDFFDIMGEEPQTILILLEVIIVLIASILKSVYQIYAAIAIGQLAEKFRLLISLGAYVGISIALAIIAAAAVAVGDAAGLDIWLGELVSSYTMSLEHPNRAYGLVHGGMAAAFVLTALQLAAFHIIAERLLTKKLNLV